MAYGNLNAMCAAYHGSPWNDACRSIRDVRACHFPLNDCAYRWTPGERVCYDLGHQSACANAVASDVHLIGPYSTAVGACAVAIH